MLYAVIHREHASYDAKKAPPILDLFDWKENQLQKNNIFTIRLV